MQSKSHPRRPGSSKAGRAQRADEEIRRSALPGVAVSRIGRPRRWPGMARTSRRRPAVALGIDHHGHTGSEPYRAEGFLCLWERAADLTALLNANDWREVLGGAIENHAYIAGFSAGAYTAMLLVGARVAYSQFEPDNPHKSPIRGPREFPDLADHISSLLQDETFLESWNRRRNSFRDDRLKAALAIAPVDRSSAFPRKVSKK